MCTCIHTKTRTKLSMRCLINREINIQRAEKRSKLKMVGREREREKERESEREREKERERERKREASKMRWEEY